jgi:hypothetical protein
VSRSSGDLRLGLNEPKGYLALLILAVDAGMDGPQRLAYGIGMMRGTHHAHLRLMVGDGGG